MGGLTLVWSGISIKRNMFVFNIIFTEYLTNLFVWLC